MRLLAALTLLALSVPASAQSDELVLVLEFRTMAAVSGPYVGPANPIRGVGGGGVPWRLDQARGELRANLGDGTAREIQARLEIQVRGLVVASTGINPSPAFRGLVSCQSQSIDGSQATVVNVSTGNFPADSRGDSDIDAVVMLPNPCFAPIVFVTNAAPNPSRWFAVTGY
jgi:hypothetical protein